jgi:DNA-binding transcriptional LysR family regulator
VGEVDAGLYRAPVYDTLSQKVFRSPDDLEGSEVGMLRSDDLKRSVLHLRTRDGSEALCTVRARLIALNPWLLSDAALASDLVVVLPRMVGAPRVDARKLEPVLPDWSVTIAPVNILYTSKRYLRPATRAFIDFVAARLRAALSH